MLSRGVELIEGEGDEAKSTRDNQLRLKKLTCPSSFAIQFVYAAQADAAKGGRWAV